MAKSTVPPDPDRVIAPDTVARRGEAGDANALWRYERHRRTNLLAQPGPLPVALALVGLKADFNVPKIFRSAQAFGVQYVHLVNIAPFDPAPAKGAFKHVPAHFHTGFPGCRDALQADGFELVALDPYAEDSLMTASLPARCAFVLGHESDGLTPEILSDPSVRRVRIPHVGQLDSLNVAVAASIALYEFMRRRQA